MRARICARTVHPRRSSALLYTALSDAVRAVTSGIKRPCLPPVTKVSRLLRASGFDDSRAVFA